MKNRIASVLGIALLGGVFGDVAGAQGSETPPNTRIHTGPRRVVKTSTRPVPSPVVETQGLRARWIDDHEVSVLELTVDAAPGARVALAAGQNGLSSARLVGVYTMPRSGRLVLRWRFSPAYRHALEGLELFAAASSSDGWRPAREPVTPEAPAEPEPTPSGGGKLGGR